jgi:neutral ceramidase
VRRGLSAAALALLYVLLPPVATPVEPAEPTMLRAGAARMPLRIPAGTPLAGYGSIRRRAIVPDVIGWHPHAFWFKPGEGSLDEVAVRALVLYMGERRVTWIAADLVAVDQEFMRRLRDRLTAGGIRAGTLIVSPSHTHSGPGAFLGSTLFAVAAVDREDAVVRDAVLHAMVEAVRTAGARARDARLASALVEAPPATRSRLGGEVDREIVVLKLTTTAGEPLALLWNYAIHGTMLGPRNLRYSGDVMGVASRTLETALGVPALFVNGAVGDVSPRQHGEAEHAITGRALAEAVRAAWEAATPEPITGAPLVARTSRVPLPAPALSVRRCTARWVPEAVRVPLGPLLPADTELVAVAMGRLAWVTMPGEPITALGRAIKEVARQRWPHAFVAGLSNDYLGYFVRPEDYARPGYVTCAAIYGAKLGPCLVDSALTLLEGLGPEATRLRRAQPMPESCDFGRGAR